MFLQCFNWPSLLSEPYISIPYSFRLRLHVPVSVWLAASNLLSRAVVCDATSGEIATLSALAAGAASRAIGYIMCHASLCFAKLVCQARLEVF